jgi:mono/diheme cytochrome c family protein
LKYNIRPRDPTDEFRTSSILGRKILMTRFAALAFSALFVPVVAVSSRAAQAPPTRPLTRSIWDGVYTAAQAQRGEQLYATHCGRCHGADLAGVPWETLGRTMPETMRSPLHFDRTPELTGPRFYANYDRLPLADLVQRIRISMPQDKPGMLTRQDVVDVVAYILSFGGFPLGRSELMDRMEGLQEIEIVPYRR